MMRTVLDKLGWKGGMEADVWRLPEALKPELAPLLAAGGAAPVFRIGFARTRADLAEAAAGIAAAYRPGGRLWLCYPKKRGRITSDITRDIGWEPIHALGLLGVAQVALDQDWSALRFRLQSEIATLTRNSPTGRAVDPGNT